MNLNKYSVSAAQPGLAVEQIKNLPSVYLPISEQHMIAEYLDEKTAKIDGLIGRIQTAIVKLREYRSSLITAAVTGKIDVRG